MKSCLEVLIEEPEFYKKEMKEIEGIVKNENIAKILLQRIYSSKGDIGLTLIPYINCGSIGEKAIECLRGLTEIRIFREIVYSYNEEQKIIEEGEGGLDVDWEHYYELEKAKVVELSKEVDELKSKIEEISEENQRLKETNEKNEKGKEEKEKKKPGFFKRLFGGKENREENIDEDPNFNPNIKVCLLGPGNSGKTALLRTCLGEGFTQEYRGTIGAEFKTKDMEIEGEKFRFAIWDTAGQMTYFSLIPMYLRDAQALIGVFDLTDSNSFKRLNKYIECAMEISSNNTYLYIIGMKSDLADKRQVPQQMIDSYVEKIKATYVEASAVNNNKLVDILTDIGKRSLSAKVPKTTE